MNQPVNPAASQPPPAAGWQQQYQQYQQAAQAVDAGAVDRATEEGKQNYDNGENLPVFRPTKEGMYQIRILPRFDNAAQWWLHAELYSFGPQGLPRGFSPKVYGESDIFDDFICAHFPYDENNRINMDYRKLRPKRRVLALVFVRHVSGYEGGDYDPGQLYVWDVPLKRSGWEDYVEPHIKAMAAAGIFTPCDLNMGYDAVFRIAGRNRDRKTMDFQFVGDPGPVFSDMSMFENIMNTQYMPLHDTFRRLTNEDMQQWIDYFQPCVDMVKTNPHLHVDPQTPQCKASAEQWLRQTAAGYGAPQQQGVMPPPQVAAPPMPTSPATAGAPAYQPGIPQQAVPQPVPQPVAAPSGVPAPPPPPAAPTAAPPAAPVPQPPAAPVPPAPQAAPPQAPPASPVPQPMPQPPMPQPPAVPPHA